MQKTLFSLLLILYLKKNENFSFQTHFKCNLIIQKKTISPYRLSDVARMFAFVWMFKQE